MSIDPAPRGQLTPLKQAYLKLEEMQAKFEAMARSTREPIAIIGIGCRFPGGAESPEAYWRLLQQGADAIGEIPSDRWPANAYYDPQPGSPGKMITRWGGFLPSIDRFDPQFFGIAPREAISMDPQQRLLLEVSWEALENAGQAPDKLANSQTGVYIGICKSDYLLLQLKQNDPRLYDVYFASGNAHSVMSGRLSYVLGLQGPSISIDTACSSSLVAVHLACQSLRTGECRMALAGGVNVILSPENTISFSKASMLAADGRCKTFDAAADGFVQGEGCGVVVLKRLSEALADGNRILALIRGSAVNQDGPSSGLTAPNGPSQVAVIRQALASAGVLPSQVSYVEAHGTATSLGDPIEVQALGEALGHGRRRNSPLMIGSVKTNIGHLETAAGIASLIKVVLSLQHREIPAHLHLKQPNPFVPWEELPIVIPTEHMPWPQATDGRIAGVSSFGFSGTNAHIVLQEAPEVQPVENRQERPLHLLTLSAKSEKSLRVLCDRFHTHLLEHPWQALSDVCFTANAGRAHFSHRAAAVVESSEALQGKLEAMAHGQSAQDVVYQKVPSGDQPRIAFLFTGQGSQYASMGRKLYESQPVFRAALQECDRILGARMDRSLLSLLYPPDNNDAAAGALLDQTDNAQPAIFALEYALAQLWSSWGIVPSVVMGHSLGEYVAACVAGVFSLEDGLKLIAARSRLMQALPSGGRMVAVFADERRVNEAIGARGDAVSVAAVNGPQNVVISGNGPVIEAVLEDLSSSGIAFKSLNVSHAFHSQLMEPMLDEFERLAAEVHFSNPKIRLISNVSGQAAVGSEISNAGYWRRHIRQPVLFQASLETLYRQGYRVFVELGAHPVLLGMGASCLADGEEVWIASLRKGRDDWRQMLTGLGALYVQGVAVDWFGFDKCYQRQRLALPTYPFQRERCWLNETGPSASIPRLEDLPTLPSTHPLLGRRLNTPLAETVFATQLNTETLPYLADHKVHGLAVFPTTAYLEMVTAAGRAFFESPDVQIQNLTIEEALLLNTAGNRSVELILRPLQQETTEFQIFSLEDRHDASQWKLHASGTLQRNSGRGQEPEGATEAVATIKTRCSQPVDIGQFYRGLKIRGLDFGPSFRGIEALWRSDGEAYAQVRLPQAVRDHEGSYQIHPALLDACIQAVAAAVPGFDPSDIRSDIYMPMGLDEFRYAGGNANELFSHVWIEASDSTPSETLKVHVRLYDEGGKPVAQLTGLHLKRVDPQVLMRVAGGGITEWLYEVAWQPRELSLMANGAGPLLLEPVQITERTAPLLPELGARLGVGIYDELNRDLDTLCTAYITSGLRQMGFEFTLAASLSLDNLARALKVDDRYHRLLERFLKILSEQGVMAESSDGWQVCRQPRQVDPQVLCGEMLKKYTTQDVELRLLRRCAGELAALLRAEADPLQLLFPGGNLELASRIYRDTPLAVTMNTVVKEAVRSAIASVPVPVKVRILEIGAGTGGTTAHVVPALPAERTAYVFSDIGQTFLAQAAETFGGYAFMDYRALDIEKDPLQQGFGAHQFDLVIAANVLHATADLSITLAHVKQLLAPQGLLLLVEATRQKYWYDLTFGFTNGWWKFTDRQRRSSSPLLDQRQWQALLTEVGFDGPAALPADGGAGPLADNAMILARAPAVDQRAAMPALIHGDGGWIIFADRAGLGERLAALFRAVGQSCDLVFPGARYVAADGDHWTVNPLQPDDFHHFWRDIRAGAAKPCKGIVHLWPLDDELTADSSVDQLMQAQDRGCRCILHTLQAMVATADAPPSLGLWLVTRGVQSVDGLHPQSVPAQAPVWGMAKVIALEHPELRCVSLDLDPSAGMHDADALFTEITSGDGEDHIAHRQGRRYVARLVRSREVSDNVERLPATAEPQRRWELTAPGTLDGIELRPVSRRAPGPGEVEIRVRATGLNFRDVLNVLGMRQDSEPLGGECSGTIVAVGPGVDDFRPDDDVVAITQGAFATFVTAGTELVAPKPPSLTYEQAAASPLAYLTAFYALHQVGQLRQGERILIHAAAGGVGMAAVHLAKSVGAEIYATAGSPQKRAFLKSMGIRHVMDSRTLEFADHVMAETHGQGLDMVLNALTDAFIPKSLALLRNNGRFLEIGKSQILTPQQAAAVNPKATYVAIDLAEKLIDQPRSMRPIFLELMARFTQGSLETLPIKVFSLEQTPDAFRYMAQAKHIGKIVIAQPDRADPPSPARSGKAQDVDLKFRSDGTYLITGGLAGLGLVVAQWMVTNGARRLALMARSEPDDIARKAISEMSRTGAEVIILRGDVSVEQELDAALKRLSNPGMPLCGVIHCAGVLDDGILQKQQWARFENVMAPKVRGAWLLHRKTMDAPLDLFVLFSSMSAIFGSAGQANHAAANAFLDALAHYRRALGLPGLSLNWGAWSEIGAAVKHDVGRRITSQGVGTIPPDMGLRALTWAIHNASVQVAVSPVNWPLFLQQFATDALPPFYGEMAQQVQRGPRPEGVPAAKTPAAMPAEPAFMDRLAAAAPNKRRSLLLTDIQSKVMRALGLDASMEMDRRQPLSEMGLDSLMAVELRNALGTALGLHLPATLLFDYPSIEKLTDYLGELTFGAHGLQTMPQASHAALPVFDGDALDAIENLSDEEIDQILGERSERQTRE